MRLQIYGASDDLIEVDGDVREEFYVNGEGVGVVDVLGADQNGIRVTLRYGAGNATWSIEVCAWSSRGAEADEPAIPRWGCALRASSVIAYSPELVIDTGDEPVTVKEAEADE